MNRRHRKKYRRVNVRKRPLPTPRECDREIKRLMKKEQFGRVRQFAHASPEGRAALDRYNARTMANMNRNKP